MMQRLRLVWRILAKRHPPVERPPMPPQGAPGWLEWTARYHPAHTVRMCAIQALAQAAERKAWDDRLRQIIREELQLARGDE